MVIITSITDSSWRLTMQNYSNPNSLKPLPGFSRWDGDDTLKVHKLLCNSWAQIFREQIYPLLPAREVANELFCANNGRPSKDVTTYIGLLILQEYRNITDEETVFALATDYSVQYALHIDEFKDETVYITRKSFWDFKDKVREKKLQDLIFNSVTMGLVELHKVDTSHVRQDSVHIMTNMKSLSRGGLFHRTIDGFLGDLKKQLPEAFNTIDITLSSKYLKDKTGYDYFGGVRPSERAGLIESMAKDILTLVRMFANDDRVSSMESFCCLQRVLNEQCIILPPSEDNPIEKVTLKEPKDVASDSLQNPSDPDAGYDGHKGKGHQVQIVETFQPVQAEGAEKDSGDENDLSLILHVKAESAAAHDSDAFKPAIEDLKAKGAKPKVALADTLYGSDENVEYAKSQGVELISPVPGKKTNEKNTSTMESVKDNDETEISSVEPNQTIASEDTVETEEFEGSERSAESSKCFSLADFATDAEGKITNCPMGHSASTNENKKGTGFNSNFDLEKCKACPCRDGCPVRIGKRKASIGYKEKDIRIADRRKEQEQPEFKKKYRKRSGIEATNSVLARKFGIKRLRVRGAKARDLATCFKALALNIWRTASFVSKKAR
jgi:hypothetical protein